MIVSIRRVGKTCYGTATVATCSKPHCGISLHLCTVWRVKFGAMKDVQYSSMGTGAPNCTPNRGVYEGIQYLSLDTGGPNCTPKPDPFAKVRQVILTSGKW
jgi:hypothetical protein